MVVLLYTSAGSDGENEAYKGTFDNKELALESFLGKKINNYLIGMKKL